MTLWSLVAIFSSLDSLVILEYGYRATPLEFPFLFNSTARFVTLDTRGLLLVKMHQFFWENVLLHNTTLELLQAIRSSSQQDPDNRPFSKQSTPMFGPL